MSGEYASGMIRATLMACPRRGVVLVANPADTAATLFVAGFGACLAAYLVGAVMLPGSYTEGSPMPALLGIALCFSATGLLGLAAGTVLRHSAGAVTTMVTGILAPSLLGPLLGGWAWWVAGASPVAVLQKLAQSSMRRQRWWGASARGRRWPWRAASPRSRCWPRPPCSGAGTHEGRYRGPPWARSHLEWAGMTLARPGGVRGDGTVRPAVAGLRALWRDLSPSSWMPVADLLRPQVPWLGWLLPLLVVAFAVVVGTVAAGQAARAGGAPTGPAITLGIVQGLALVVALSRPMAGFWLSLLAGMLVSEVVRAGGPGPVWAEPSLLAQLAVLAIVGLQARPRVLIELWLLTLLAGVILVQRMPGLNASRDLAEMTTLSAVVLLATGALAAPRDPAAVRRAAADQRRRTRPAGPARGAHPDRT